MKYATTLAVLAALFLVCWLASCGSSSSSSGDDDSGPGDDDDDASPGADDDQSPSDDDQSPDDDDDDATIPFAIVTVDGRAGAGDFASLALDAKDKAHVSYRFAADATDWHLEYATNVAGSWAVKEIDGGKQCGEYGSLAVEPNGAAHVAYYDRALGALKHITNTTGVWVAEIVDHADLDDGRFASLILDNTQQAHIVYQSYNPPQSTLKYATNPGGVWAFQTIDDSRDAGGGASIMVDSFNTPRVAYHAEDLGTHAPALMFAGYNGHWNAGVIDGDQASFISLARDTSDKARLAYIAGDPGVLKYATDASGKWAETVVDGNGNIGGGASLALDSDDHVYIAYHEGAGATTGKLKYATNKSGAWATYVVDKTGDPGAYCSLKIDSQGYAHIAYYEATGRNLKYATNAQ